MKFRFNYNGISQPRIFILIEFVSYSRQLLANAAVLIINNIKTNGMTTMTTTGNKLKMQLSEKKNGGGGDVQHSEDRFNLLHSAIETSETPYDYRN